MRTSPEIRLLGVSFRTASSAVREALAFDREQTEALLRQVRSELPGLELLVLSTCNRTELYLGGPLAAGGRDRVHEIVRAIRPDAPVFDEQCWRYEVDGAGAVRHLVTVACGLDSAILGDREILSQLRAAHALAASAGTSGKQLAKAVGLAIRSGKLARAETDISLGAAGIGSAVAATIGDHDWLVPAASPAIAILGTGEAARSIGRHLAKVGHRHLVVVGRSIDRARSAAAQCGGVAVPWSALDRALVDADAVVTATSARQPVLSRDRLAAALAGRGSRRPPLVIDASFPAGVEAGAPVPVIPLESVRAGEDEVLAARRAAIGDVEVIVDAAVDEWQRWAAAAHLDRLIGELHAETERACRESAALLDGGDLAGTERIVRRAMRRVLHGHSTKLRALAAELATTS